VPSDKPLPAKSKQKHVMPRRSSANATTLASMRQPALPWQYTTHGSCFSDFQRSHGK
jgi:hypothetical protein